MGCAVLILGIILLNVSGTVTWHGVGGCLIFLYLFSDGMSIKFNSEDKSNG